MAASVPEDLGRLFCERMKAGDLDGVMALYEPEATFRPEPGRSVGGTAAIREAMQGFLALGPNLTIESKALGRTGDIALTTSRWSLEGTGPDGPVRLSGQSVEVARRQSDGSWLYVVDTPWGLEWQE